VGFDPNEADGALAAILRPVPHDPLLMALGATIATTRQVERDLFGSLDEATLRRPIRENDWDPKDVQAHLSAWKARQADRYAAVREDRALPSPMHDDEEDALNAELRGARLDWSWPAIVDEADAVAERLIGEIHQADPERLRNSDRLLGGTLGNGILHALTHVHWLLEAGVPLDRDRVAAFAEMAHDLVTAPVLPDLARAIGVYDLACFHALSGSNGPARVLLREAFTLDPEMIEFSQTDPDLAGIREDLADIVRSI
jgi:hypothetical protein